MESIKCVINRDNDNGTFSHVKKMVVDLYSNDSKYNNCLVILGYNLGKNIDYYRENYPNKKIIVYQLEQLFNYNPNWFNPKSKSPVIKKRTLHLKKWLDECDEIWDYDISNKWFLENIGYNKVKFMPMKYSKSLDILENKKNPKYDILFYGSVNKKRFEILQKLNSKFNLVVIGDSYDVSDNEISNSNIKFLPKDFTNNLDEVISNSKIVLNLHFYETSIQEQVRLFYLLNNNKCVVSEKSKKNYFGDLIHEYENYNDLERLLSNLLKDNKWYDISKNIKTKFKERNLHNIKVGVSYNSFYNVDVLKKSIESIINVVDYVCVIHQKKSFSGEIGSYENEQLLLELQNYGYIDELVIYETEYTDKIDGMIDKRNLGLEKCKSVNCEYIMTLDNDECYNDRQLREEVNLMKLNNIDTLYSPIITYYKSDKYYFLEDKLYVPSIYKIDDRKYGRRIYSSVLSDPARKMVENKYLISRMYMHHLTYLENNFKEKIGSKILFNVDKTKKDFSVVILENLQKWSHGDNAIVIGNDKNNENILVYKDLSFIDKIVNEFDIKNEEKEITIIIPTFNNIEYLEDTLQSIINSIKNIECEIFIGIDGCEKTLEYVKYKSFDSRIRFYYFEKNVGPYVVKNSLSLKTNSNFLVFFDSDDIMTDSFIQDIMNKKNTHDLIKPMYLDFKGDVNEIDKTITTTRTYGEGVFGINKNLFLKMNGFEGWKCAADSDLMTRLYKNNVKLTHTKQIGFYRRIHPNSLTQHPDTNMSSKLRGEYSRISKLKKFFGPLPKLITERFQEVSNDYINNTIIDEFKLVKDNIKTLLTDVIKIDPKPKQNVSKINYDLINNILNRKEIYHPSKHIKPSNENKPINRNEIFELKKGTLAEQNLRMFGRNKTR